MSVRNYNTNPYYDDYNQEKNFYRILFKPGVAVQARELSQLQTILQEQISRFGSHVFEEGSIVIPGNNAINNNYQYVKLELTFNDIEADNVVESLEGQTVSGMSSGIKAEVVGVSKSENGDPPTLFVKYLNSGSGINKTFVDGEKITNNGSTVVRAAVTGSTGVGSAFVIEGGVLFTKGTFTSFETQSIVLSKYSTADDIVIGFEVNETIITSENDGTLLDPAQGSYNYAAPGADRYSIDLTIANRATSVAEPENFIELLKVEAGEISFKKDRAEYAYLEDTLARRTYDESGNYIVKPYKIKLRQHLNGGNTEGLYTAANGGDDNLLVAAIKPGKAYVLGYEVDNVDTRLVNVPKARTTASVNNGLIRTNRSSYVEITKIHDLPDFSEYESVTLFDQIVITDGSPVGNSIGTARVKGIEFKEGLIGQPTAVYYAYIFDVEMNAGKSFERDVKSLSNGTFTANIQPNFTGLTGTISYSGTVITGAGTRFLDELKDGDYITPGGTSELLRVTSITDNNVLEVDSTPSANQDVQFARVQAQSFSSNLPYIYRFPQRKISTHSDEVVYARRVYNRNLTAGSVDITANVDEVFTSWSNENYFAVVKSGGSSGSHVALSDTDIELKGSPSGRIVTVSVPGLTNEQVDIYTTVQKTNSAANEKVKSLIEDSTIEKSTEASAQAATIFLDKADVYQLKQVLVSKDGFGQPFNDSNVEDITSKYTFNNGQTPFYYGVSFIKRRPGAGVPDGPIKIVFDYFSHGPGDYFSVNSYSDIDYEDIPSFITNGQEYNLADCLDFRPRISDNGANFIGAGSSLSELIDFNNDVTADYEYYLARTDKIYVNSLGQLILKQGAPAVYPQEPEVPENGMGLFTLKLSPYTAYISDVKVVPIDNRRYTMKDIGKIDNRVKNLEYYTSLSLLEKDTASYQIKDEFGFDRFKNGFVVDQFTGHKVGNTLRSDHSTSVDFTRRILGPSQHNVSVPFIEKATSAATRSANNYIRVGNTASLPFTDVPVAGADINVASSTMNVNPYNVTTFVGTLSLEPNSYTWKNTKDLGDISFDNTGDYSSLAPNSEVIDAFGSLYADWRETWYGTVVSTGQDPNSINADGSESIAGVTDTGVDGQEQIFVRADPSERSDIVVDGNRVRSYVPIPYMESVLIKFRATGLRPNTKVQAFFDGFRVTSNCYMDPDELLASLSPTDVSQALNAIQTYTNSELVTDPNGTIEGVFVFDADTYKIPTGEKVFRLTDSSTDGLDKTTLAQTTFFVDGDYILQADIETPEVDPPVVVDDSDVAVVIEEPPANPVPQIEVSPTSRTYNVDVGLYSEFQPFTIKNVGDPGSVLRLRETPPATLPAGLEYSFDLSDFEYDIDYTQQTLNAGESVTFYLRVKYDNEGTTTGSFSVESNDPSGSVEVTTNISAVTSGPVDPVDPDPVIATEPVLGERQGLIASIFNHMLGRQPTAAEMSEAFAYATALGITNDDPENATVTQAANVDVIDGTTANAEAIRIYQLTYDIMNTVIARDPQALNYGFIGRFSSGTLEERLFYSAKAYTYWLIYESASTWNDDVKAATSLTETALPFHSGDTVSCPPSPQQGMVYDPLAQTFFLERSMHLTKVDLFFQSRAENIPVRVQLRKTVNGFPGSSIIAGSEVTLYPSDVLVSATGEEATTVTFDYPIYLEAGEYALVVLADTQEYNVWVAEVGENDVATGQLIDSQPSVGSLFKSQNSSTWTPDQSKDLKIKLYRADFDTGVTATVDFVADGSYNQTEVLEQDPFEIFQGSAVMKVYHRNHGLTDGTQVVFDSVEINGGTIYGVDVDDINSQTDFGISLNNKFTVSNATQDTYTVTLGVNAGSSIPGGKVRFGGSRVVGPKQTTFDIAYIHTKLENEKGLSHAIKTTNSGYTEATSFTDFDFGQDIEFTEPQVIANELNQTDQLSGNPSLTYRAFMTTDDRFISPMISLDSAVTRGTFSRNRLNNPETDSILNVETVVIASSGNIGFSVEGTITFGESDDQALVARVSEGTLINVVYDPAAIQKPNEGSYRVVSVAEDGSSIQVAVVSRTDEGTALVQEDPGATITINNESGLIAEEVFFGGSAYSKYITRKIEFVNPSTALNLRIATSRPSGSDIKFYYKIQTLGDTTAIDTKEFVEMDVDVPLSLSGGFIDIEKQIDNLPAFSALVFKIVFTSDNSSVVPRCKDLRLIALA